MQTVAILLATLTPYQPTETVFIPAVKTVPALFTDRPNTEDNTGQPIAASLNKPQINE